MKKVSFIARNFEKERFLTYDISEDSVFDEEVLDFLEEEEPKGLVPIIYEDNEGKETFSYDVTNKIRLCELSGQEINAEMVLKVMRGIVLSLIDMGEYRVSLSYLVMNRNYIYINSEYEVEFICIPLEDMADEVDVNSFLRSFMANLRFESSENGDYVAKLLSYINNPAIFNLRNLLTLIEDLMSDYGIELPEDSSADIYVDYQEILDDDDDEEDEEFMATTTQTSVVDATEEVIEESVGEEEEEVAEEPVAEEEEVAEEPVAEETEEAAEEPVAEEEVAEEPVAEEEEEVAEEPVAEETEEAAEESVAEEEEEVAEEPVAEEEEEVADESVAEETEEVADESVAEETEEVDDESVAEETEEVDEEAAEEEAIVEALKEIVKKSASEGAGKNIKPEMNSSLEEAQMVQETIALKGITEVVPDKPKVKFKTKDADMPTVSLDYELDEYLAEREREVHVAKYEESGIKIRKNVKVNRASLVKSNQEEVAAVAEEQAVEAATTILRPEDAPASFGMVSEPVKTTIPPKVNPYLIRVNTEERIMITKQNFKVGKANMGVDYTVKGNGAVSRVHAIISYKEDVYYIKDNKSTNHTVVNGRTLEEGETEQLTNNCKIMLGNEEFVFKLG